MKNFALQLKNLTLKKGQKLILEGVSCDIPKNQFTAIVGPNGAGKTFLLRSLAGLEASDKKKQLYINQTDFRQLSEKERAKLLAWNPERINLPFNYTSSELCMMGRFVHHSGNPTADDWTIIEKYFKLLNINSLMNKPIFQLSSGEFKKVLIVRALAAETECLLLDEPTANLDISSKKEVFEILKQISKRVTVVAVIHDIAQAYKNADNIIILNQGRVIDSGPPQNALSPKNMQEVFSAGCEVVILNDGSKHLVVH